MLLPSVQGWDLTTLHVHLTVLFNVEVLSTALNIYVTYWVPVLNLVEPVEVALLIHFFYAPPTQSRQIASSPSSFHPFSPC